MRQRRQAKQSAPVEGHQFCPLCGEAVPVSSDGRCDLGHRVNVPHVPSPDADQDASAEASPDAGSSWTPGDLDDAQSSPDWDDQDLNELGDAMLVEAEIEEADASSRQNEELSDDADEPRSDLGGELDW